MMLDRFLQTVTVLMVAMSQTNEISSWWLGFMMLAFGFKVGLLSATRK